MKKDFRCILGAAILSSLSAAPGWAAIRTIEISCGDPADVQECRLPSAKELDVLLQSWVQNAPEVARMMQSATQNVGAKADAMAGQLELIAAEEPGTRFAAFYLKKAADVRERTQRLNDGLSTDLMLAGSHSSILAELAEIRDAAAEFDGKIAAAEDSMVRNALTVARNLRLKPMILKFNDRSDLRHLMTEIDYRYSQEKEMIEAAISGSFPVSIPVDVEGDVDCPSPFADYSREFNSNTGAFAMVEDAAIIRKLLNGTASHKGALTIVCKEAKFVRSSGYDPDSHTLRNDYKFRCAGFSCMGGAIGNVHAMDKRDVVKTLRQALK